MSLAYRIMYRVGFTPWHTGKVASPVTALMKGQDAVPPARALDIGCGTGTQAVSLAQRGWQVTAIDALERPLRRTRVPGQAAGVTVDWILGEASG
jgi:2-polyprenyl-3-methyl-5-hydroxy-6-metoxy-1,4-benzoquinol methylase